MLCLLGVAMCSCASLRLPGNPPAPGSDALVPSTPTIAPLLLTPVATVTPPASSDPDASATPTFGLPLPDPTCEATPAWGLGDVWNNEEVRRRLGCQIGDQVGLEGEELYFQGGHMLWRPDAGLIYVLTVPFQEEGWSAFVDTYREGEPASDASIVEPTPASGVPVYMQPTGRFGKVWRENSWLRMRLGWALVPFDSGGNPLSAQKYGGVVQDFEHGALLWNGDVCFVLRTADMSWTMY